MQKLLGYTRRAVESYGMLSDGDRVAVGVSGGKDSVALLVTLARLRAFIGIDYALTALTLDPGFGGVETDYSPVAELCAQLGVPYELRRTQIGEIVFDIRHEPNPCALCAKMRRGALHNAARELGCNKVALGHHNDDAIETFLMNLYREGRIGCFQPVTWLSRKELTVIRPLVFAPERDIASAVKRNGLPVVKSRCPADGNTAREEMKRFILETEKHERGFKQRIFGAMTRGLWDWVPIEERKNAAPALTSEQTLDSEGTQNTVK